MHEYDTGPRSDAGPSTGQPDHDHTCIASEGLPEWIPLGAGAPVVVFDHGGAVATRPRETEPDAVTPSAHPTSDAARISHSGMIAGAHLEAPLAMPNPEDETQERQRQRSREASRRWRETHPDAYHAAQKRWQETHREEWNAYRRAYRQRTKQE